ncbi:hypothetical protein PUN4_680061 [Paraburkholderia unamae]|nr:hypothetical protein PUN4_680061 [Paraburkholderia unamae]
MRHPAPYTQPLRGKRRADRSPVKVDVTEKVMLALALRRSYQTSLKIYRTNL